MLLEKHFLMLKTNSFYENREKKRIIINKMKIERKRE